MLCNGERVTQCEVENVKQFILIFPPWAYSFHLWLPVWWDLMYLKMYYMGSQKKVTQETTVDWLALASLFISVFILCYEWNFKDFVTDFSSEVQYCSWGQNWVWNLFSRKKKNTSYVVESNGIRKALTWSVNTPFFSVKHFNTDCDKHDVYDGLLLSMGFFSYRQWMVCLHGLFKFMSNFQILLELTPTVHFDTGSLFLCQWNYSPAFSCCSNFMFYQVAL